MRSGLVTFISKTSLLREATKKLDGCRFRNTTILRTKLLKSCGRYVLFGGTFCHKPNLGAVSFLLSDYTLRIFSVDRIRGTGVRFFCVSRNRLACLAKHAKNVDMHFTFCKGNRFEILSQTNYLHVSFPTQ